MPTACAMSRIGRAFISANISQSLQFDAKYWCPLKTPTQMKRLILRTAHAKRSMLIFWHLTIFQKSHYWPIFLMDETRKSLKIWRQRSKFQNATLIKLQKQSLLSLVKSNCGRTVLFKNLWYSLRNWRKYRFKYRLSYRSNIFITLLHHIKYLWI